MEKDSGKWIMYGVDWDDPECIHTVDEAIEYIETVSCSGIMQGLVRIQALFEKREHREN